MAGPENPLRAQERPVPPQAPGGTGRPSGPPTGPRRGRRRRLLLWGALALLLVPLGLVALLLAALQTQPGRDLLRDAVVAQVSGPDLALGIARIGGAPPGRLVVEGLSVADGEGVWLEADRILLDWSPLALLGGTLEVAVLEAGRIELSRLPAEGAAEEPAPDTGFELPTLPLEIELERLEVGELALGAPVLGEPLAVSIAAALAAERQGSVESRLQIAESGGEGSLEAEAVYRLSDRNLRVSLQATAPQGGRFSRVSGLPGAPALAFDLEGDGPLPGWRGDWRAEASPVVAARGQLGIESLQPLALLLSGRAEPGPDFPAEAAPWLSPALAFDLALDYDAGAETARLEVRELSSGALAVTGSAEAALAQDSADAQLSLVLREQAPLSDLVAGLAVEAARFEVSAEKRDRQARIRLQGDLERPFLADALEAGGAGFERVALELDSGELDLEDPLAGGDPARLDVTAQDPFGDPALLLALDPTTTLSLLLAPAGQALRIERLELASGPLELAGSGRYQMAGEAAGSGEIEATLRQDDLARFSGLAGLDLGGSLALALDGRLEPDGAGRARLTATPSGLRLGLPAADALLGEQPSLVVEAQRSAEGLITVEGATLTGTAVATAEGEVEPLRLSLQGTLSPEVGAPGDGTLDATASLALPHLAVLQTADLPLSGSATLDLTLFGPLAAPQAVWALRADRLAYQGGVAEDVRIDGSTIDLADRPSGRVELAATLEGAALQGGFDYALEGEQAIFDDLSLTRGSDRLTGSLAAQLAEGTAEGELRIAVADLSAYRALLGQEIAGSAEVSATLSAADGRQGAALSARARTLAMEGLTLAGLTLEAEGSDLLGTPSLRATLAGEGLEGPDLRLTRLSADLEGGLQRLAVEASLEGEALRHALTASAAAEIGLEEETRIRLDALDVRFGEETLALAGPAEILLGGNRTRVQDLVLAVAEGRLALEVDLRPGAVEATLEASGLPVRLARLAAPELDPQGTLDLTARLSGAPPRPEGSLTLVASALRLGADTVGAVPPLELRLDGRLADGRLTADGRLSGFAQTPLTLEATVPLLVTTTPFSAHLPENEPLRVQANWEGRLEQLMGVMPIDAVRFGGAGRIDLGISGSLADPTATGSVTVEQGFYQNYTLGMQLDPVSLQLSGRGRRLELERFEARDDGGGSMTGRGFIDLSGGVPRFELTFTADNAHIARRDDVSGALDAELALEGTTEGARLSGRLRTRATEIRLIDALPPSVTELEVVEVNDETPRPEEEEAAEAGEEPVPSVQGLEWLALGVEVDIPGQVFVRGRGLDSEWRGALEISGTAERPRILGRLSPVRGSFDFAGRVFELNPDSTIQFLGGPTIDPELDLTATYRSSDLLASIVVYGAVSDPQLQLTSSPPLPEDEILARVLFGKTSGQLSAGEAVQLAQAAETLQGGGGEGLIGIARRTLGVDVLSFAPGDAGDEVGSLRIGKYVSEDVFIGAEQGTGAGSSTAIVEWELTPNITVESEVGADSRSNASVKWKWDY
ncbi:MAG: translocation/assembly module TamB domain-containing protein [Tistlia sp.]|uniref:translocation/assembly module TamB domain-containing protein n=1 Tax=Tistlia sp. TaxID=3057121 RepID=UPI0034A33279